MTDFEHHPIGAGEELKRLREENAAFRAKEVHVYSDKNITAADMVRSAVWADAPDYVFRYRDKT